MAIVIATWLRPVVPVTRRTTSVYNAVQSLRVQQSNRPEHPSHFEVNDGGPNAVDNDHDAR
jgi:hypothetical protein